MSQTNSPLDEHKDWILELSSQGQSCGGIAITLSAAGIHTSDRSVRRAFRRWGVAPVEEKPGVEVTEDTASVTSTPSLDLANPEQLIRERGLDPDDWEIATARISEWGVPGEGMKQLRVNLRRRKPFFWPSPGEIDLGLTPPEPWVIGAARLVVIVGDQQAPYHNPDLHALFCAWLRDNRPHQGVTLGDTIDLPTISRHPYEPEWAAAVQECCNAGAQILFDYRQASDTTHWTKLEGNHDTRLRRATIDNIRDFYGLRPAQLLHLPELPPIHDPVNLLRLDELGIEYLRPKGSYDQAQLKLSPYLAVRHGWIAKKGSGSSALASLDHLGHSIVVGHTHRQSLVHQTKYDIDGEASTQVGVETGCMCRIEEGLGYAVAPDWQNGFATATIWPDGTFHIDLATYVNSSLYWRDQRYNADG